MADQGVASYDPVFWFYHCNLYRLWFSWQTIVGATTLAGFKSTLTGDTTGWRRRSTRYRRSIRRIRSCDTPMTQSLTASPMTSSRP